MSNVSVRHYVTVMGTNINTNANSIWTLWRPWPVRIYDLRSYCSAILRQCFSTGQQNTTNKGQSTWAHSLVSYTIMYTSCTGGYFSRRSWLVSLKKLQPWGLGQAKPQLFTANCISTQLLFCEILARKKLYRFTFSWMCEKSTRRTSYEYVLRRVQMFH